MARDLGSEEAAYEGFQMDLRWGESIRIFRDPWLKGKIDFCVEDNPLNGIRNESVSC